MRIDNLCLHPGVLNPKNRHGGESLMEWVICLSPSFLCLAFFCLCVWLAYSVYLLGFSFAKSKHHISSFYFQHLSLQEMLKNNKTYYCTVTPRDFCLTKVQCHVSVFPLGFRWSDQGTETRMVTIAGMKVRLLFTLGHLCSASLCSLLLLLL
jgi:hypothetical protein